MVKIIRKCILSTTLVLMHSKTVLGQIISLTRLLAASIWRQTHLDKQICLAALCVPAADDNKSWKNRSHFILNRLNTSSLIMTWRKGAWQNPSYRWSSGTGPISSHFEKKKVPTTCRDFSKHDSAAPRGETWQSAGIVAGNYVSSLHTGTVIICSTFCSTQNRKINMNISSLSRTFCKNWWYAVIFFYSN